ncbi:unnamed protein product [Gadus morhua 'NCC']
MAKQPQRAPRPLVRTRSEPPFCCFPEATETSPTLTIKPHSEQVGVRKRSREDPEEGPTPSKRLRTTAGQRAPRPLVRTRSEPPFCCFPEATETSPTLTIKPHSEQVGVRKRSREDPEEGPTPSKRLRTTAGQRAYRPLVRTLLETGFYCVPKTPETSPSLTIAPPSEEGGVRQRKRSREDPEEGPSPSKRLRTSYGQQPPHVEAVGGPEDPSEARVDPGVPGSPAGSRDTDGADRGLSSSGGVEHSDHSSPRISSSCRTRLTTCSTADFDALYEELQQLGQGGFGSVFAGYRKEDRLPVAIKHIPMAKVTMTQETVEGRLTDFPLEVSLMLRAAEDRPDPGAPGTVVLLLDWFQLDQELILVQERPSACVDLLSYMESKGGRLQEQDAKMILHQVVEGIQGLHSRGVLHRDIKPENLLVETGSGTPRVRVIDLGCGCRHNSGVYSEFSGTASYIPPEWFTLQSYRADPMTVWQLGVLLYELLTGDVPFQTSGQIIWKMVPCIKNCKDFLKRCLNKRAGGRLALGSLLHHPWLL